MFPNYGYIAAHVVVETQQVERVNSLVAEIAEELAHGSISDDEFQRAMMPHLNTLRDHMRGNSFWVNALVRCQEETRRLDFIRSRIADNESITRTEIESLAGLYLGRERTSVFSLVPEPKGNLIGTAAAPVTE